MAYLPTRDSSNMMNGMYAAQKIIKKAIFFTEHLNDLVQSEDMIDGRACLFVLAGIFLIVAQVRIASIPNSQACLLLRRFA
jgi:hypothetical protein